jgi:hypothetical protein
MIDPRFIRRMLHARAQQVPARFDPPPRPSGPITIRDDAYHYQDYASSPGAFWYTEWWYFNFHDPATGIDGICTFAIFNPGDKDFLGAASLTACVFVPGETMADPVIEYFELSDWSASYDKCDVTLGKSRCEALDAQTYRVTASTSDGGILLDLTYTQADAPQFLAHDVHGKDEPWEVSSWLVYMPSARVSGTVLYRGRTYRLQNAVGYHDHDWGMWHVYAKTWSWAYMSSPDKQVSFDLGFHAAFQLSDAYFRYQGLRLIIPEENFKITQDDWVSWDIAWKYPTSMTFSATDGGGNYQIDLAWKVTQTAALWKYPVIVFEQAAHYVGRLQQRIGGNWQTIAKFDEPGFCEYTSLWYEPT